MDKKVRVLVVKAMMLILTICFVSFNWNVSGSAAITKTTPKSKQPTKPIKSTAKKAVPPKTVTKAPAKIAPKTPAKTAPASKGTVNKDTSKDEPNTNPSGSDSSKTNVDTNKGNDATSKEVNNNENKTAPTPVVEEKSVTVSSFDDLFTYINTNCKDKLIFKDGQIEKAYDKAKDILKSILNNDMSEFEKEKAIHDYVIRNSKIVEGNDADKKNASDVLLNNSGDPFSYAQTIKLLLNLSNIECDIVSGQYTFLDETKNEVWNLVKIGGQYYHLDAALDNNLYDTSNVNNPDKIGYDYFNLSDSAISKDHTWDKAKYKEAQNTNGDIVSILLNGIITKIKGEWIYYANESNLFNLSRCKFDGSVNEQLYDDSKSVVDLDISGNYLYYKSDNIYMINLTDGSRTKINQFPLKDVGLNLFDIYNNNVYFLENTNPDEDSFEIYKMQVGSLDKVKVVNDKLDVFIFFKVVDGYIYFYRSSATDAGLYKLNLVDNNLTKLVEGAVSDIAIKGEYIYYTYNDVSLIYDNAGKPFQSKTIATSYRMKLDGIGKEQLGEPTTTFKDAKPLE